MKTATPMCTLVACALLGASMALIPPAMPVERAYKFANIDFDPASIDLRSLLNNQKAISFNSAPEARLIIQRGIDNVIIAASNCGVKLHEYAGANPEVQELRHFVAIYMSYYSGGAQILFDCSDDLETAQDLPQVQQIWADAHAQLRTHCLKGLSELIGVSIPPEHQEALNAEMLDIMRIVMAEVNMINAQLEAFSS